MTKYRKRPTEVEAWQVGSDEPMPEWVKLRSFMNGYMVATGSNRETFAYKGDWVVDDGFGARIVGPNLFEQTYEVVE